MTISRLTSPHRTLSLAAVAMCHLVAHIQKVAHTQEVATLVAAAAERVLVLRPLVATLP